MQKRENNFLELIYSRRSALSFSNKRVSNEKIDKIIGAGLRAPSSKDSRPWFFLVLRGRNKNKIGQLMLKDKNNVSLKIGKILEKTKILKPANSVRNSARLINECSVLILIYNKGPLTGGEKNILKNPEKAAMHKSEILSIGSCMENLLLAAHSFGLSAVPIMDTACQPYVKKQYKIHYDLIISIAIGYPKTFRSKRKITHKGFIKFEKR